jgi:hypothetical protein
MGLIDLRTDLKSLRYGNDQRGGGSSNQPYITTSIPEGFAPTSTDFLLRNGYLNPVNSFQDVKRLSKFFTDTKTPNGLLFTIKQQLLERQNPKLVNINRIYNPLGTLAQAGLNSLGFHVNKQGLNPSEPSYFNGGTYGYYYATRGLGTNPQSQFLQGEGYENRLTIAYTAKIEKKPLGSLTINPFGITNLSGENILLSYSGGPNAPLGLGITNIRIKNPTRTVDLPKDRTTFRLKIGGDNIANKNYLTYTGKPNINWVLDEYKLNISNQVIFDLDLENNQDILFTNNVSNILNRSNDNVVSTLYAPISAKESTLEINRLGSDPSKPEYYTPTSLRVSNYGYQVSSSGVTEAAINRFKLVTDRNSTTLPLENRNDLYFSDANIAGFVGAFPKNVDESNNVRTFSTTQLLDAESAGKLKDTDFGTNVIDFRSTIDASLGGGKIVSTNYSFFNRENKSQDQEGYGTSKTSFKGNYTADRGRVLNPNIAISNDQFEIGKNGEDIIDFNFRILNPANTGNNRLIDFRAYLESWSDGVKADYNPVKYMGRAESFYKYGGFSRDSSIEFLVPALSRGDMISNYRKVNMMMWACAPNYSSIGLMRGNITEVSMGSYFRSMPSIIKSVDVVEIDGMGWDINRNQEGKVIDFPAEYKDSIGFQDPKDFAPPTADDFFTGQLPKGLKITVQFTPLHQFTPEYGQAFIGQNQTYAGPLWNQESTINRSVFFSSEERNYFQASPK